MSTVGTTTTRPNGGGSSHGPVTLRLPPEHQILLEMAKKTFAGFFPEENGKRNKRELFFTSNQWRQQRIEDYAREKTIKVSTRSVSFLSFPFESSKEL